MNRIPRIFLFGALALVLLIAGCGGGEETSTPVGTLGPGETSYPSPLETNTPVAALTEATSTTTATEAATSTSAVTATTAATQTPAGTAVAIDVNVIECQFCIDTRAFALLDVPAIVTFEIVDPASPDPDTVCNTVDTYQDRQVVLCRAPEETSITVNVCTDANTCSQVTVDLQACPDVIATTQPGATNTNTPTTGTGATATSTPTPATEASATPGVTSTPTP
jgi:hypothetical protein